MSELGRPCLLKVRSLNRWVLILPTPPHALHFDSYPDALTYLREYLSIWAHHGREDPDW